MKKFWILVACVLMCACFAGSSYAFELERLEVDTFVPAHLQKTDFSSTSRFVENLSVSGDFRLSLVETKIGHFGIEGTPVYDIRNSNLDANFGLFYRPIKFIEVHYDHDSNVSMSHLQSMSWKGNDIVGVRLIIKE